MAEGVSYKTSSCSDCNTGEAVNECDPLHCIPHLFVQKIGLCLQKNI